MSPKLARPGFTFCISPDPELALEHIGMLLQNSRDRWSVKIYWGDQELPGSYWQDLSCGGLFAQKRALVLRCAHKLQAGGWKELDRVLARYRSEVWPFFVLEVQWAKGKPKIPPGVKKARCWQVAAKKDWIWQSPGLTQSFVEQYWRQWAKKHNLTMDRQVLARACEIVPPDLAALKAELEKLRLYVQDKGRVEINDLEVIAFHLPFDIFDFLRQLQGAQQADRVWQIVLAAQERGDAQFLLQFLGAMLREVRILWRIYHGEAEKIFLPVRVKRAKTVLAGKLGSAQLMAMFRLLMQVEVGFKSGALAPSQAISLLVHDLLQLFNR